MLILGDIMDFYIENLELLSVLQLVSPPRFVVSGRPSHGLVFRRSGAVDYDFGTWKTRQEQGEVILLPKGTVFTATPANETESTYTVINFLGDFSVNEVKNLTLGSEMINIYTRLDRCAAMDPERERYWILSDFYGIIAQLAQQEQHKDFSKDKLSLIEPALELIRKNLYDPDLNVQLLHAVCGLSRTYFRSLFVARFGVSPKKYILDRRLIHAKQLLESGECRFVREAARISGFEDPLYFSRIFKARYGYPPSEISV